MVDLQKKSKSTPNGIVAWLFKRNIKMQTLQIHKHPDRWAISLTTDCPDKQFCYSIVVFGDTLKHACGYMIDSLEAKEWT